MRWERTGREVKANGESTTLYESGPYRIEARKIGQKNYHGGLWYHTEFYLFRDGRPITPPHNPWFTRLSDAKAAAEQEEDPEQDFCSRAERREE